MYFTPFDFDCKKLAVRKASNNHYPAFYTQNVRKSSALYLLFPQHLTLCRPSRSGLKPSSSKA
jgi:hypothetical protein